MSRYKADRTAKTGETFNGRMGGFVPGKPCACGCGKTLPASSPRDYKNGHKPGKPCKCGCGGLIPTTSQRMYIEGHRYKKEDADV